MYIDDPAEIARLEQLEADAERDIPRIQREHDAAQKARNDVRQPVGGRNVVFRVSSTEQAQLEELAAVEGLTPNLVAKRIVLERIKQLAN